MMLATITAIVASIMGTSAGLTVMVIPSVEKILANIKFAEEIFSATFKVIKNMSTGNKSNKNFFITVCRYSLKIND
jgi:hypothetical protein